MLYLILHLPTSYWVYTCFWCLFYISTWIGAFTFFPVSLWLIFTHLHMAKGHGQGIALHKATTNQHISLWLIFGLHAFSAFTQYLPKINTTWPKAMDWDLLQHVITNLWLVLVHLLHISHLSFTKWPLCGLIWLISGPKPWLLAYDEYIRRTK